MASDYSKIDFHKLADDKLAENGYSIKPITQELMETRITDFMNFVNGIRSEYSGNYGWKTEPKEYFLNGLVDKWKFSFTILNENDELCSVNFASVYGESLHLHCLYTRRETRSFSLGRIHMLKMYQAGMDNRLAHLDAYWPKNNNRSIILFLKMGWQIESIRNNKELFMIADMETVRNNTYELVISGK